MPEDIVMVVDWWWGGAAVRSEYVVVLGKFEISADMNCLQLPRDLRMKKVAIP